MSFKPRLERGEGENVRRCGQGTGDRKYQEWKQPLGRVGCLKKSSKNTVSRRVKKVSQAPTLTFQKRKSSG